MYVAIVVAYATMCKGTHKLVSFSYVVTFLTLTKCLNYSITIIIKILLID